MIKESLRESKQPISAAHETKMIFSQSGIVEYLESVRENKLLTFCRPDPSTKYFYDLTSDRESVEALIDYKGNSIAIIFDSKMKAVENGDSLRIVSLAKKITVEKLPDYYQTRYENDYHPEKNVMEKANTSSETIEIIRQIVDTNK